MTARNPTLRAPRHPGRIAARSPLSTALALCACLSTPFVHATNPPTAEHAAHGTRPSGMEMAYAVDTWSLVSGGKKSGSGQMNNLDVKAYADLDHYAGLPRTLIEAHLFYNDGGAFSGDHVGDAQGVSNIETGVRLLRVHQAWIEYSGIRRDWSIRGGLMDVNSEFDSLQASGVFLASAHGMGTDIAQSGLNGPSTFPSTSVGIRTTFAVGDSSKLRTAIMDAVPHDPEYPKRSVIRLSAREGLFAINEFDYSNAAFRLLAGRWMYSRKQDGMSLGGGGATCHRSAGVYVRGEMLAGNGDASPRAFFRVGTATGGANVFDRFASMGIAWNGIGTIRAEDETGLAIIWARTGPAYRRALRESGIGGSDAEAGIELTHRFSVSDGLAIQPSIQYVIDPAARKEARNALVVGLRLAFRRSS